MGMNMAVTIKKIADSLKLSTATVSKVLSKNDHDISEQTKLKVLAKAHEMNYTVNTIAQSMRTHQTKSIGLILPDIKNYFFTDIATSIEDELLKYGYSLYYCNTYEDLNREIKQIKQLVSKRADGIIIAGTNKRNISLESKVHIQCPIVAIDRKINYGGIVSTISSDNYGGAFKAVTYLCESGHKNIMYISGPANTNTTKERKKGYFDALKAYGISVPNNYIRYGKYTAEFGYQTIMDNAIPKNVTAILCGNDLIAVGIIKALYEKGISVPRDMSIIGYDDTEIASLFAPALTTVRQASAYIGQYAVNALIKYFQNADVQQEVRLEQELVIRQTTKSL